MTIASTRLAAATLLGVLLLTHHAEAQVRHHGNGTVVRDHRTPPIVRDHRPVVRDHRGETNRPRPPRPTGTICAGWAC